MHIKIKSFTLEQNHMTAQEKLNKKHQPVFNILLKDDKSFLYIGITDEEFPRVLALRKTEIAVTKLKYIFGPFPSARTVRLVLRMVRKIFPYCTQSPKIKKACFYSHLNLCRPCPALIRTKTKKDYLLLKKDYLTNIKNLVRLLKGEIKPLLQKLQKEMINFSQKQEYEKAQRVKKQIQALEYITKPYYQINAFLTNPNFVYEERSKTLTALYLFLKPYLPQLNFPRRIEGIDIANIAGYYAAGSLVVFLDGYQQPDLYRRFKIKTAGPNDPAMIREVLLRRLKHQEWPYPDLMLIDGGKPQVGQAVKVLPPTIPVVGLAKKLETIVVFSQGRFSQIKLKKEEKALQLLQAIRDEAHRFAQSYHQILRKQILTKSF